MTEKVTKMLVNSYQSGNEETEDEEVKRNCIFGESGMRDSDLSDTDFEEEGEEKNDAVDADEGRKQGNVTKNSKEVGKMDDLVKFVTIGSEIIKPNGVVLYRPTPVLPTILLQTNESHQTLKEHEKRSISIGDLNPKSGFSITSKDESEAENSVSCGSSTSNISSSGSDGSDASTESIDSEANMKSASLAFPITDRDQLPTLEVIAGTASILQNNSEDCHTSVFDDEEEPQGPTNDSYALVGASGASVDDMWGTVRQKRVLSSNTLSALNAEAGRNEDSTKRKRGLDQPKEDFCAIPEITLGIEALDQIIHPLPRQYIIREDSPSISSSCEKEDEMLSEELEERFRSSSECCSVDNPIIPLLTPPQSPRTIGVIEWPSNLVMDSTIMTAYSNLSPVSTSSNNSGSLMSDQSKIRTSGEFSTNRSTRRCRTISVATT